ncbi:unnamed protein product [Blepharisma stoltei]|uniref:FYVE-type domain-containing protein n=1 Tax=Blepharisma stoltei TaxID=1481888 RepID=A0AAU9IZC6_9CILI|nr:unnamed protein product [Blepharisma stoltei]
MDESDKAYLRKLNSMDNFSSLTSFSTSQTSTSSFLSKSLSLKPNGSPDFKNDNKCHICEKKFSLTNRRHHCRYCGNSVCEDHSTKRRVRDESKKARICDNCDREIISGEIKDEIENEMIRLQNELQSVRELNERLSKEHKEKFSRVNSLEAELTNADKSQKQKEQDLQNKLNQEEERGAKARTEVEELRRALEQSHSCEREINDKCAEYEARLANLKSEGEILRERKEELITQIDHLTNKLKGSLPLDQIKMLLCPKCQQKLNQTYRPFSMSGSMLEEDGESMS